MPEKNGFEVLSNLRQLHEKDLSPLILFTTCNDERHIEQSQRLGATLYFEKPRHYETFSQTLHSIISPKWS